MTQTELRQYYQSLVYTAVWKCPECNLSVHGNEIKGEYKMENKGFTLDEIERAAENYCSDCYSNCDECNLRNFICFELSNYLHEVINNE